MEEEKIKIVTRTQVYLDDPEFFCNKSWTLSFNFNTKSWVSFHSYLPNWYIGENNFFYSGINGCCDDTEVSFDMETGVVNRTITTTTTTTDVPFRTTTSTTTLVIDCELEGTGYTVACDLTGTAIITTPSTPTTTQCIRPPFLLSGRFFNSYILSGGPITSFTSDSTSACAALSTTLVNFASMTLNYYTIGIDILVGGDYEIGQVIYDDGVGCTYIPDGWYFDGYSFTTNNIYHVVGGILVEILTC